VKPIVLDTDVVSFLFKGESRAKVFVPQFRNHGSGAATWSRPPAGHAAFHGGIFVKRNTAPRII
jgi:hypothetical protein